MHLSIENTEGQCGGSPSSKEKLKEGVEGGKDKLTWGPELS